MQTGFNDGKLIYLQVAQMIEDDILRGIWQEEEQVPSTNELSKTLRINPATAAKGLNRLVEEGILYKKRGIGMFVSTGGKQMIMTKRKEAFGKTYIAQMLKEAKALMITKEELINMIQAQEYSEEK